MYSTVQYSSATVELRYVQSPGCILPHSTEQVVMDKGSIIMDFLQPENDTYIMRYLILDTCRLQKPIYVDYYWNHSVAGKTYGPLNITV